MKLSRLARVALLIGTSVTITGMVGCALPASRGVASNDVATPSVPQHGEAALPSQRAHRPVSLGLPDAGAYDPQALHETRARRGRAVHPLSSGRCFS